MTAGWPSREQGTSVRFRDGPAAVSDATIRGVLFRNRCFCGFEQQDRESKTQSFSWPLPNFATASAITRTEPAALGEKARFAGSAGSQKTYQVSGVKRIVWQVGMTGCLACGSSWARPASGTTSFPFGANAAAKQRDELGRNRFPSICSWSIDHRCHFALPRTMPDRRVRCYVATGVRSPWSSCWS